MLAVKVCLCGGLSCWQVGALEIRRVDSYFITKMYFLLSHGWADQDSKVIAALGVLRAAQSRLSESRREDVLRAAGRDEELPMRCKPKASPPPSFKNRLDPTTRPCASSHYFNQMFSPFGSRQHIPNRSPGRRRPPLASHGGGTSGSSPGGSRFSAACRSVPSLFPAASR